MRLLFAAASVAVLAACGSPSPAAPAPDLSTLSAAPATATPATRGPVPFAPGLYEVGPKPGQIHPGTYTSPGPDGSAGGNCYWAELHGIDEDKDIDANGITPAGPATMVVKPGGLYVRISGCTFTQV